MSEEKVYSIEDVKSQIKPLSQNAFVRLFQKIWRWWLGVWYDFSDKHPKLAEWIYKIGFFCVISMGITVVQYIMMTFLPYAFESLNHGAAGWPDIEVGSKGQKYMIFGDAQGWGYFIAFELAVFIAQCINFPLQRNITYRSHGNPWWQAMWYFIGWVIVSVATLALWGIINVYLLYWGWPDAVTGLVKTFITGAMCMVVYFFIFLIIFPDNNKVAKKAQAKYEKLTAKNAPAKKIVKAEERMKLARQKAAVSNAEKEYAKAKSQASNKAMRYLALIKAEENTSPERIKKSFHEAIEAVKIKEEKEEAYQAVKAG